MKVGRVLLSRDDELHTRGYFILARALREAGLEVVLGGVQTPRETARAALEEDVEVLGYRIMTGAPEILVPRLLESLRAEGRGELPVVIGGIVPPWQVPQLLSLGVKGVFVPGNSLQEIVRCFQQLCQVPK